jgi:hypothetical protein
MASLVPMLPVSAIDPTTLVVGPTSGAAMSAAFVKSREPRSKAP